MPQQTPLHEVTAVDGGVFVEDGGYSVPAHFGDPLAEYQHARSGAALFDRSSTGTLEVSGREAAMFLHNVASADVKSLAADAGCEGFLCNHTARVLAHFFLFRDPPDGRKDRFWLDLPSGQAARVHAHLDHHLISEDATLANRTHELCRVHLAGPGAARVLAQAVAEEVALEPLQQKGTRLGQVRRTDLLGVPGYDIICAPQDAANLWSALKNAGAAPAGREAFELLRVEAGFPLYGIDITDQTFAPEVGRTRQAISYNKGCYLGQEPIVMARDRGQVNRTLLGVKLQGPPVPAGCFLYRAGKEVGKVTSSVLSPRLGSAIALAYIRRGNQEPGTNVEVEGAAGRQAGEVAALPFAG